MTHETECAFSVWPFRRNDDGYVEVPRNVAQAFASLRWVIKGAIAGRFAEGLAEFVTSGSLAHVIFVPVAEWDERDAPGVERPAVQRAMRRVTVHMSRGWIARLRRPSV